MSRESLPAMALRGEPKARIAYVVAMANGLESFVKREIEEMARRGYGIDIFATTYRPSPGFNPPSDMPLHVPSIWALLVGAVWWTARRPALVLRLLGESILTRGVLELLLALSWARSIKVSRVQLIHCAFGDRKFFAGYFIHRLTGVPLTVAIHAHEIYAQPNEVLFRRSLNYTSGIVTISEKNRRLLTQKYDMPRERIDLIKLSIDLDFWRTGSSDINVLTVARFTPRKGWAELIESAKRLDSRFHFFAVGFGEMDIVEMAGVAGVSDRFTVFPKLQPAHLRLLMQACDIFCLPSKATLEEGSEGIPVVLMEAMAMGMPIVATDDGSIDELVDEEIVPAGDVDALVDALRRSAARITRGADAAISPNRTRVEQQHGVENLDKLDQFFSLRLHNI